MSGRSHVDVSERRLRPVYDCLDNGNYKKAVQEAEKVLKKQRDFQCAKVLKALALLRLAKRQESTSILEDVHSQIPTDEATLQAMSICYREMHRLDLIADMYTNAHKARPDNEEVLSALFMAHVRLEDYKKQQQAAMTLHRLRPNKNPYYFWAVMSIVMQAHASDDKLAKTMFLPLAERMTQKYVKEEKIDAEAEVRMFLIILELMEKFEPALQVIQGPLGEKLTSELHYREIKTAELFVKLGWWPQANAAYRCLLVKEPDHWNYYQEYFTSLFMLIDQKYEPSEDNLVSEEHDWTVDMAIVFLKKQLEAAEAAERPIRGPYLAELELLKLLKQRGVESEDKIGSAENLLEPYYRQYGSKACCATDLAPYVSLLHADRAEAFMQSLLLLAGLEPIEDDSTLRPPTIKNLQMHLTIIQLSQTAGLHDNYSKEQKLALVQDLIASYQHGLRFGTDLLSTDQQYSDPYLQLAIHLIYDIWAKTGERWLMWQAIMLLEKALQSSPSNFQFKILLIKLYSTMGAFEPCTSLYESMEIKHIQNDVLGFVVSNHVGRLGHLQSAEAFYDAVNRFFNTNEKDTTEYLISAYKYGSFTKVHEFVKFRERLKRSYQDGCATVERLILDIIYGTTNHESVESVFEGIDVIPEKDLLVWNNHLKWEDLQDNRDLSVIVTWDPHHRRLTPELKKQSLEEEIAWLKLRNDLLRCLISCVDLATVSASKKHGTASVDSSLNNSVGNKPGREREVLSGLLSDFTDYLSHCSLCHKQPFHYPLAGPFRTRTSSYVCLGLGTLMCEAMKILLYIHSLHQGGFENLNEKEEERMQNFLPTSLGELVASEARGMVSQEGTHTCTRPDTLENLVLLTEFVGLVAVVLGCCYRILKPIKQALNKKSKKKKEAVPTYPETFTSFNRLVMGMEREARKLLKVISETENVCVASDLATLCLDAKPDNNGVCLIDNLNLELEVKTKVEKSYLLSAKDLTTCLTDKVRYLESIML